MFIVGIVIAAVLVVGVVRMRRGRTVRGSVEGPRASGRRTAVRRHRTPRHGDGTAWLVADRANGDFICGWYVGPSGDRLAERARAGTAADAVAWGRFRTTRVRIRTGEACSYWAGTASRPDGFTHTWSNESVTEVHTQARVVGQEQSSRPGGDQTTPGAPRSEHPRQLAGAGVGPGGGPC